MIKLASLISPCIIGLASNSPTVKEAAGDNKPQGGQQQGAKPGQQAPTSTPPPDANAEVDNTINNVDRENSATDTDNFGLDSNTGMAFLLSKLVSKAKEENTIDSLAASFVDNLKISDFGKFKEATKQYSQIDGYPELLDSISNMIDNGGGSEKKNDGGDQGGGEGEEEQGGLNEGRIWNLTFVKKNGKTKKK